jgi:Flp pilus assembly pilin Flp
MTVIAVVAIAYITIPVEIHEFHLSHNLDTFFDINTTKLNLLKLSNST